MSCIENVSKCTKQQVWVREFRFDSTADKYSAEVWHSVCGFPTHNFTAAGNMFFALKLPDQRDGKNIRISHARNGYFICILYTYNEIQAYMGCTSGMQCVLWPMLK